MDDVVDLTITMLSFNSRDITRQALKSIYKNTKDISFEIIVADNGSNDGSVDMIKKEYSEVILIRNSRNLGFAMAHNMAMQRAKGRYILVLNNDVLFLDNAAKKMIEVMQAWPRAGALGPRILNPDGSYVPSASYRQFPPRILLGITILNHVFPFVHYLPLEWLRTKLGFILGKVHGKFLKPTITERVEWVDGASVLFCRDALEETGLFDEQFFFDMEIGDLLYRIRQKGWEVVYDPGNKIIHLGGYSRKSNIKLMRHSVRSMLIYYAKYRPKYIPFIKALYSGALWLKSEVLELIKKSGNEVNIYCQIRTDVRSFSTRDAYTNQVIPTL